jgi:hypothetical protein
MSLRLDLLVSQRGQAPLLNHELTILEFLSLLERRSTTHQSSSLLERLLGRD